MVGLVALLILAWLVARSLSTHVDPPAGPAVIGYGVAVALWLAALLVFELARGFFMHTAHYTAAILMFVCILLVVVINSLAYKAKTGASSPRNRYAAIAAAMGLAVVVIAIARAFGWDHWILALEAALIGLFAIFWATQTKELCHDGLR